jgi:quercetin dioxygenase-like cupin family protein
MEPFGDVDSIVPKRLADGLVARSVDGALMTLALIELDASASLPEHSHDNEQLGILITGSLDFRIGSETRTIEPGGTWCIPGGVPHTVTAGPGGAVVIEAFAPSRADWSSLARLAPGRGRWP